MLHDDAVLTNDAATPKTITGTTPPKPLHRVPAKPAGALVALLLTPDSLRQPIGTGADLSESPGLLGLGRFPGFSHPAAKTMNGSKQS